MNYQTNTFENYQNQFPQNSNSNMNYNMNNEYNATNVSVYLNYIIIMTCRMPIVTIVKDQMIKNLL